MISVDELFFIESGQREYHSKAKLKEIPNGTPLITAKTTDNGIAGYYDIKPVYKNCISLSVVGENACTAFFQKIECCINDNCLVLIPKEKMTDKQMLFYTTVFRLFKEKFPPYGRNITIPRIKNLLIPSKDEIPEYISKHKIQNVENIGEKLLNKKVELNYNNKTWKRIKLYPEFFEMEAGDYYPDTEYKLGKVPLISSSKTTNGMTKLTDLTPTYNGNCITIGKVACSAFYQEKPFCATADCTVLIPKFDMNKYIGLFIATIINREGFKWNYGRQIRLNNCYNLEIDLPVDDDGKPNFSYMEEYIKSLKFSKAL